MQVLLRSLLMAIVMFGSAPTALGQGQDPPAAPDSPQYCVQCRILDAKDNVLMCPKVIVTDGHRAVVSIMSQAPFVTAVTSTGGVAKPHIQVISEGTTIELTVIGQPKDTATVDVTVEQSKIGEVAVKNGRQSVQVDAQKKRLVECVSLGKTLTIPIGNQRSSGAMSRVELVVSAVSPQGE